MGYFWGWGRVLNLFVGSTHVVVQLSFCMFPSTLTFDFDLNLGLGWGWKTVLESTHVVERATFISLFPSILRFDFDLILGSFFTFLGP